MKLPPINLNKMNKKEEATTARMPEIEKEFNHLSQTVEKLGNGVVDLVKRIDSVLYPESPKVAEKTPGEAMPATYHATRIRDVRITLESLLELVQTTIGRVEI